MTDESNLEKKLGINETKLIKILVGGMLTGLVIYSLGKISNNENASKFGAGFASMATINYLFYLGYKIYENFNKS